MLLQNASINYVKYRKEESEDKAFRELINEERVAEVTAKQEGRVNMRNVTWNTTSYVRKHMRRPEGGKYQDGSSAPLRKEEETT